MAQILRAFPNFSSAGCELHSARALCTEHSRFEPDTDSCRERLHEMQKENRPGSDMAHFSFSLNNLENFLPKSNKGHEIQELVGSMPVLGVTAVHC